MSDNKDQKPQDPKANENKGSDNKGAAPKAAAKTVKQMAKLVAVRFIKPYAPYVVGDVAGFNEKEAAKLVDNKIAKKV